MSELMKDFDQMGGNMSSKHSQESHDPPISDEKHEEPPVFSLAMLGLQPVGTVPPPKPKSQLTQRIQLWNASGLRNHFSDDTPPQKTPMKRGLPSRLTPTKVMKNRKSAIPSMPIEEMKANASAEFKDVAGGNSDVGVDMSVTPIPENSASGTNTGHTTPKSVCIDVAGEPQTLTSDLVSSMLIPVDQTMAQQVGFRLRNLLKLPKAHKWVLYEWFYSFMDKPLFGGQNDFQICLAESFPNLLARQLTRTEWRQIRALLGKPRRCSSAFFAEARSELGRKRQMIRYLQTHSSGDIKDLNFMCELPDKIPLPLPVGTNVTAWLHMPHDGIFSGIVDAFDSQTSTYRITFDRAGLGTHCVRDIEIVSENFDEMLPLHSIAKVFRPNPMSVFNNAHGRFLMDGLHGVGSAQKMNLNNNDPLVGREAIDSLYRNPVLQHETLNGYPMKLLETMVRLKRAIAIKRSKLQRLAEMNNKAELRSFHQTVVPCSASERLSSDESPLSREFQRRYASIVISLDKMNRDMKDYLKELQAFSPDLTSDPLMQAMMTTSYLREKCREEAEDAVERNNSSGLQNKKILQLIKSLTTVLKVTSHLENDGNSGQVSKVLEGCIEEVKSSLHPKNVETFHKHIQIHLDYIRKIIGQTCASTPAAPVTATVMAHSSSSSMPDAAVSSSSSMPSAVDNSTSLTPGAAVITSLCMPDVSANSSVSMQSTATSSSSMANDTATTSSWRPGVTVSSSSSRIIESMLDAPVSSTSSLPDAAASSSSLVRNAPTGSGLTIPGAADNIISSMKEAAAASSSWMLDAGSSGTSWLADAAKSSSSWMLDAVASTSSWMPSAADSIISSMLDVATSRSSWMQDAAASNNPWMPAATVSSCSSIPDAADSISLLLADAGGSSSSWMPDAVPTNPWIVDATTANSPWMPGDTASNSSWMPVAGATFSSSIPSAADSSSWMLDASASSSTWMPDAADCSSWILDATATSSSWMPAADEEI